MPNLQLTKKYERYPEYKDSGVEWLGKIPKGWSFRRLKYFISTMESGARENIEGTIENAVPSIGGEHVSGGSLKFSENKYITQEYYRALHKGKIKKDDILLVKDGATIGKSGYILSLSEPMAINEHLYLIRSRNHEVNQRYLYYVILSPEVQSLISLETRGSAQGGLNTSFTSNIFHEYPLLSDQIRIAKYLDEKTGFIDQIIERKEELIELLDERRTAVINLAITKGLNSKVELIESGIDWIGKIPKGWKAKKLKFLGEAIIGLTYSPEEVVSDPGMIVLRSSNVQDDKIALGDNVYVNKLIPQKLITRVGDILICSRNGSRSLIGKNAMIDGDSAGLSFGAFMTVFRSKYSGFISCFLKSNLFMSQLSTTLTATINQLTTHYLNNLIIVVPPENEQKMIIDYLSTRIDGYDKAIGCVEESIKKLQEFKSSLISNAVTGKIKV